ncbi:EutN/CcmL family microcompartment protein [Anaerosalibacter massiliensis]|uniref:EutN/CcmL family microcompartment protein n=1 Tax=Anaerosalibacter massiliensis TaxID=1347392 RepID=A0A9X2S591_9FIRM|nr:EutN/CcmL family microcompartment protein [Anaerosalibacter massiliensis]MCR2044084.1 EutN/CcmL family microcompartment protein [Anaerosalibacter massiliensis]
MYIGKVEGVVIATTKDEGLVGKKLLIVQPLDMRYNPVGNCEIAIDSVGAGTGEIVLVATGSSARQAFQDLKAPIDRSIVAIVDNIEVNQ